MERFTWKGLNGGIIKYVQECNTCQINKAEHTHSGGSLQLLPITEQKWESVSMDFIIGLPLVQGKDCIFVVVYRLTKYAHLFTISSKISVSQIIELLFQGIFQLHGLPKTIVNDCDSRFMGAFQMELFRLVGTNLSLRTSYQPQIDGKAEVGN